MSARIVLGLALLCWIAAAIRGSQDSCSADRSLKERRHATCPACSQSWAGAIHPPWYDGSSHPESPRREVRGSVRGTDRSRSQPLDRADEFSFSNRGRRSDERPVDREKKCQRENPFNFREPRGFDPYAAAAPSASSLRPGSPVKTEFPVSEDHRVMSDFSHSDLIRRQWNQQVNSDSSIDSSISPPVNFPVEGGRFPQFGRSKESPGIGRTPRPSFYDLIASAYNNDRGWTPARTYDGLTLRPGSVPRESWLKSPYTGSDFRDLIRRPVSLRFPEGLARNSEDRDTVPRRSVQNPNRDRVPYNPEEKVLVVYRADEYPESDSSEEERGEEVPRVREEDSYGERPEVDRSQVFRPSDVVLRPEIRNNPFNLPRDLNVLEFVQGIQRQIPFDSRKWEDGVQRMGFDRPQTESGARLVIEDFPEDESESGSFPRAGNVYESRFVLMEAHPGKRIDRFAEDGLVQEMGVGSSRGGSAQNLAPAANATQTENFPEAGVDVYQGSQVPAEGTTEPAVQSAPEEQ